MALEKIKMPQLGESVTEGIISQWLVSVGDQVKKYESLAEVLTDKVSAEIPSSFTGVIQELIAKEGDTITVGDTICIIEAGSEVCGESTSADSNTEVTRTEELKPADPNNKVRYSPAVLRMSQEHGIDLSQVQGSGAGGRITRKDLSAMLAQREIPKAAASPEVLAGTNGFHSGKQQLHQDLFTNLPAEGINVPAVPKDIEIPLSGMRKSVAANMVRSKHEVPHAWLMVEADATSLVHYRNALKADFMQKEGYPLTYFAFFVKAVAQALKEFPQLNSMWAGDKIIRKRDINISIAVAAEDALYVPVIKHADEKSVKGIAREITELAAKARTGKLRLEDSQQGTFTVNNTGAFGSVQSMGIINFPQAAILQVESIVKRPVVMKENMIAIRDMVHLCLSIDHRILDGLVSGRFLQRVKEIIENMSATTTPIF